MRIKISDYLAIAITFYKEQFYLFTLIGLLDVLILGVIRYTPYLNWFNDQSLFIVFLVDWILLLFIYKLRISTIFRIFLIFLTALFFVTIVGVERIKVNLGLILFIIFSTIVWLKIQEVKKEQL